MASSTKSVVITLNLNQGQGGSGGGQQGNNPTNTQAASQNSNNDSSSRAFAAFAVTQSLQLVTNEIASWAEYFWNRELTLNDDYIGQRNKNIALTQINRASGAVSTIGSMAAAGAAVGHAAGAIVGAAIGFITAASGIIRSNAQGLDQQNIALRQMDAQLQFTRSRAGWSTHAASIGEDL